MTSQLSTLAVIIAASITLGVIGEYCWHAVFHGGHRH